MRAPFFALLISTALANAYGQDTRRVTEPKFPPSCAVLTAGLNARGSTLAESDENKPDTSRIQQALDRCQPGQAVELKAGGGHDAFLTGPLELRQGVTLLIDKGVILFGSRNPRDYDLVPGLCGTITEKKVPYTQGISGHACKPLIGGNHVAGAAVMGDGIIDGRGGYKMIGQNISWWDLAEQSIKGWPDQYNNWARGVAENPAAFRPLTAPPPGVIGLQNNPRMMILSGCDNFTLYRIQLRNSPNFHVSYSGGNGFTAWGVVINTPKGALNGDGIDIGQPWPEVLSSATNVTITHCYIHAGDDNVAIKSPTGYLTSHVTVSHNHFYTGHGMSIGSATSGGIGAIRISDLTLDGTSTGIQLRSSAKLGGPVHDVEYDDVCIRDNRTPIMITSHAESFGHHEVDAAESNKTPTFTDIRFNNVLIQGGGRISLDGLDASHHLGISFHNVVGDQPAAIRAVANRADIQLDGSNISVSGDDVKVSSAPSRGTPNACAEKFVPFPVPIGVR
jgi:polygalacturonase